MIISDAAQEIGKTAPETVQNIQGLEQKPWKQASPLNIMLH